MKSYEISGREKKYEEFRLTSVKGSMCVHDMSLIMSVKIRQKGNK